MDGIFRSITDNSLRRIYKFILKRVLGRYLRDELLVEQVVVQSREGVVLLRDLVLNADKINEDFLFAAPLKIVSASVKEIRIYISYSSLLTESCKFEVDSVDLFVQIEQDDGRRKAKEEEEENEYVSGAEEEQEQATLEEVPSFGEDTAQEGLGYLAYWIQIVIAKLKAHINHVAVHILPPNSSRGSLSVRVDLFDISFHNTDPQSFEGRASSLQLSSLIVEKHQQDIIANLGNTKVIYVGRAGLRFGELDSVCVLRDRTVIRLTQGKGQTKATGIEVDISVPSLDVNLSVESLQLIIDLMACFAARVETEGTADATLQQLLRTLEGLKEKRSRHLQNERENLERLKSGQRPSNKPMQDVNEHDLEIIALYTQQYQRVRERLLKGKAGHDRSSLANSALPSSLISMETIGDDEEEGFPSSRSSSEDDHDSEFLDARSRLGKSVLDHSSVLTKESLLGASHLFSSARETFTLEEIFSLRLHFCSISIQFSFATNNDERERIKLMIEDGIVSASYLFRASPSLGASKSMSKIHVSLSKVDLLEEIESSSAPLKSVWLMSFNTNQPHSEKVIYSSPSVNIDAEICSWGGKSGEEEGSTPSVRVNVGLQPLVISFSIDFINKWVERFSKIRPLEMTNETSSALVDLDIKIENIDLFVFSHRLLSDSVWSTLNDSLRLDLVTECWEEISLLGSMLYLQKHLVGKPGGLYLQFRTVALLLSSSESELSQQAALEMDRIDFSLLMPRIFRDPTEDYKETISYWRSRLIKVSSGQHRDERISIRRQSALVDNFEGKDLTSWSFIEEGGEEESNDLGPIPPRLAASQRMVISAYKLEAVIQQREYNALIMLGSILAPPSPTSKEDTVQPSASSMRSKEASFGLRLTCKLAIITLKEDQTSVLEAVIDRSQQISAFDELCQVLRELRAMATEQSSSVKEVPDLPLVLCASIRKPIIEVVSADQKIFLSLKANDLSLFEMSSEEYDELLNEGFDFDIRDVPVVRSGRGRHRIPFIHRASPSVKRPDVTSTAQEQSTGAGISLLGDHDRFGYAFEVKLCIAKATTNVNGSTAGNSNILNQTVELFIDFHDIMWNHDPASTWLLKLVRFLTPLTASEILEMNIETVAGEVFSLREVWENHPPLVERIDQLCDSLLYRDLSTSATHLSVADQDKRGASAPSMPFEMTKILVRVRKSVINYCDVVNNGFAVLSVDLLTLYSTIVSDSPRFVLKIALKGLSLRVAPLERVFGSSQFMNQLAEILNVDHIKAVIRIKDGEKEDLSLNFNIGDCSLHACSDSLVIFVNTSKHWFDDFQLACMQSEKILRTKKHVSTSTVEANELSSEAVEVEQVRTCDASQPPEGEKLLALVKRQMFHEETMANEGDEQAVNGFNLNTLIREEFYQTNAEDKSLEEALDECNSLKQEFCIPDYDYENDFPADELMSYGDFASEPEGHANDDSESMANIEDVVFNSPGVANEDSSVLTSIADNSEANEKGHPIQSFNFFSFQAPPTQSVEEVELEDLAAKRYSTSEADLNMSGVEGNDVIFENSLERGVLVESDMDDAELRALEDVDRAWQKSELATVSAEDEQQATWYREEIPIEAILRNNYIPLPSTLSGHGDPRSSEERSLPAETVVTLSLEKVRMRLFAGKEWRENNESQVSHVSQVSLPIDRPSQKMKMTKSVKFAAKPLFENCPPTSSHKEDKAKQKHITSTEKQGADSRAAKDFLEITMRAVRLVHYNYKSPYSDTDSSSEPMEGKKELDYPRERIFFSVQDWLFSFGGPEKSLRKKVLGLWQNQERPRDASQPVLKVTMLGFRDNNSSAAASEYRLKVSILPIRCFFSSELLDFIKELIGLILSSAPHSVNYSNQGDNDAATTTEGEEREVKAEGGVFFQHVVVTATQLKIDYQASYVNLKALREGDFLQLLNILPVEGLEIELRSLRFKGIEGSAVGRKLAEAWVQDIYSTQLHRLLSGAAPLKGLFHVGSDIHALLFLPRDQSQSKGYSRDIMRSITKQMHHLARTVVRESLDLSHKMTRFLATTIADLASSEASEGVEPSEERASQRLHGDSSRNQPRSFTEGIQRAYSVVRQEVSEVADTVIAVPVRQYERLGPSGMVSEVVRVLPVAILRPLAGLTEGLSYTILGLRNLIDPNSRIDEEDAFNVDLNGR